MHAHSLFCLVCISLSLASLCRSRTLSVHLLGSNDSMAVYHDTKRKTDRTPGFDVTKFKGPVTCPQV